MSLRTNFADSDQEVLDAGFSETSENEAQDDNFVCPHCGVEINGAQDVILQGDASCCIKCNKPLFDMAFSTHIEVENADAIEREEFSHYWDEVMSLEEGASDYEIDD
jgi:predicted RNA-binding Zn-ribbon protein involved in translation (DUF1610 family)